MHVGITGNIGSGKTTVCKIFSHLGVPVYDADKRAKWFLKTPEVKEELRLLFGNKVFNKEGHIDRKNLAACVFNNQDKLSQLNAIIHPIVRKDFRQFAAEQVNAPYVIQEAAILIESGQYKNLDKIILVRAPETIRIKRVCARDNMSASQVQERAQHQLPEEEKSKYADFIIINDGIEALLPQVNQIHNKLLDAK